MHPAVRGQLMWERMMSALAVNREPSDELLESSASQSCSPITPTLEEIVGAMMRVPQTGGR